MHLLKMHEMTSRAHQAVEELRGVADGLGRIQQRPVVRVPITPAEPQAHLSGALYQVQRLCGHQSSCHTDVFISKNLNLLIIEFK